MLIEIIEGEKINNGRLSGGLVTVLFEVVINLSQVCLPELCTEVQDWHVKV